MNNIKVVDSIMGSGKTTYIINSLREAHQLNTENAFIDGYTERKFMVIVPLLTEVARYKTECRDLRLQEPHAVDGNKRDNLLKLVKAGRNIVATHSLFLRMTPEICAEISRQGYELINDEALECVSMYMGIAKDDLEILKLYGAAKCNASDNKLRWDTELATAYRGVFDTFKADCESGSIHQAGHVLHQVFPIQYLTCFSKVTVCTYLFSGSPFDTYLKTEGVTAEVMTLDRGNLVPLATAPGEAAVKTRLRALITIYEGSMNNIGKTHGKGHALSCGWYRRADAKLLNGLKQSTRNFFERTAKTASKFNGWTTYKGPRSSIAAGGYTRGFIPSNARATNDYANKASLAYLCNWFCHPSITSYFKDKGAPIDEDQYALSALIQWIWRSQIRDYKPITLYIPSERMRTLLREWLRSDYRIKAQLQIPVLEAA